MPRLSSDCALPVQESAVSAKYLLGERPGLTVHMDTAGARASTQGPGTPPCVLWLSCGSAGPELESSALHS